MHTYPYVWRLNACSHRGKVVLFYFQRRDIMRKLLTLLIAFTVVISIVSCGKNTENGKTGDCTWTLKDTVLTISGNGKMAHYSIFRKAPWGTNITKVIIKKGVSLIGHYAFADCTSLKSVDIPETLTEIGNFAFKGCTALTEVDIPDSVNLINTSAFLDCASLATVKMPNGLKHLPGGMFMNCHALKNVTLPDSIVSLGSGAFRNCTSLADINLPANLTTIDHQAFLGCSNLTEIDIPEGVTTIGFSVFSASSIKNIMLPNTVTFLEMSAFVDCPNLIGVRIPESVNTIQSSIQINDHNRVPKVLYIDSEVALQTLATDILLGIFINNAETLYIRADIENLPEYIASFPCAYENVIVDSTVYKVYTVPDKE